VERRVLNRLRTGNYDAEAPDVLVIDDDTDVRWSIVELLAELGFVAIGAENGAEGLRLAAERSPRLILLDLRMPVMDGWQFLRERRARPDLARIPVAIVTAEPADRPSGPDVQAVVEKPAGEEALRTVTESLLAGRAASKTGT
jgi:CheY-like chemotaxis protein